MKKLLTITLVLFTVISVNAQSLSDLVFESTITPTTTSVDLTFNYNGISAGDKFEWQLILAKADESPDWGSKNITYLTDITPNGIGSGTQTITFNVSNGPINGEVYTWAGKITVASTGVDLYNNTGNLVTISTTAGLEDAKSNAIAIYPNPVLDEIFVKNLSEVNQVKVIDITGKTVKNVNDFNQSNSINVSALNKGVYFLIFDNKKQVKFLKN